MYLQHSQENNSLKGNQLQAQTYSQNLRSELSIILRTPQASPAYGQLSLNNSIPNLISLKLVSTNCWREMSPLEVANVGLSLRERGRKREEKEGGGGEKEKNFYQVPAVYQALCSAHDALGFTYPLGNPRMQAAYHHPHFAGRNQA